MEGVRFHVVDFAADEANVRPVMTDGIDSSPSIR
jgi:hypothetical protein